MIINDELLDKVAAEAEASPRLRMNHNLHDSLDAKAQRLINMFLPGTPLPIHRQWYTVEVIESSAILEVKDGSYTPLTTEDILY